MKRIIALSLVVMVMSLTAAQAQSLKGLGKTLKNKVKETTNEKVDTKKESKSESTKSIESATMEVTQQVPKELEELRKRPEPPIALTSDFSRLEHSFFYFIDENCRKGNYKLLADTLPKYINPVNERMKDNKRLLEALEGKVESHELLGLQREMEYYDYFVGACEQQVESKGSLSVLGDRKIGIENKKQYLVKNGLRVPYGTDKPFTEMMYYVSVYSWLIGAENPVIVKKLQHYDFLWAAEMNSRANPSKLEMPAPKKSDATLNAQMLKLVKARFSDTEAKPVKVVIVDSDWTILRNPVGNIIGRRINTNVVFKNPDGSYNLRDMSYEQPYQGNNKYGATELSGIGLMNLPVNYSE